MASPPWTDAWDETKPADTDLASTLGLQGRTGKLDIRQRMAYQHVWGKDVNTDGAHINLILSDPDTLSNTEILKSHGAALTGSGANPLVDLAANWNTSGKPTAVKVNVTDAASDPASLLMDLQVNGVSVFSVDKHGTVVGGAIPTGSGQMFFGASAPTGWLLCDGSAVSRTTYAALFALLGTTYGAGDGVTTFNLPDLRQRFPLGKAVSGTGAVLGAAGGNIDHTHTSVIDGFGTGSAPVSGRLAISDGAPYDQGSIVSASGFPQTGANNPPFLAVNFIVKT